MMELVEDIERTNNAWAVGRLDVLASNAQLPEQVAPQSSGQVVRGRRPHQRRPVRPAPRRGARRRVRREPPRRRPRLPRPRDVFRPRTIRRRNAFAAVPAADRDGQDRRALLRRARRTPEHGRFHAESMAPKLKFTDRGRVPSSSNKPAGIRRLFSLLSAASRQLPARSPSQLPAGRRHPTDSRPDHAG